MIACIINALLYSVMLWKYYQLRKSIDIKFVVLALYSAVAICGIGYFMSLYEYQRNVSILPFLYLFLSSYILFKPLDLINGIKNNVNYIFITKGFITLVVIYVVCSSISLYNIWTDVVANIISGDWQSVKVDAYMQNGDDMSFIAAYTGAFSKYFSYAILPYCFYRFTNIKNSFKVTTFILILTITTNLFQYLLTAYRGGIFSILMLLIVNFLLFKDRIPRKRKKTILYLGVASVVVLLSISFSITNSRFEDSTTTTPIESLFSYFGQSMINYNGGIASSATSYMGGKYFFMSAWGLEKPDFWIDSKYNIRTNNGSDFDTLIGCFYIDFGPILAFVIFVLISLLMKILFKSRQNSFATLYILMFYIDMLIAGVFHGPSYMSQIIFNVMVIYILISLIEKYENQNSRMLSQR